MLFLVVQSQENFGKKKLKYVTMQLELELIQIALLWNLRLSWCFLLLMA